MCRLIRNGCIVLDTIECSDPRCPMRPENCVPMNAAAVEQRRRAGLPDHPEAAKPGETPEDVVVRLFKLGQP